ncbi:peptidyl-tRNA hydrolase, mitochondrial-like [Impatiens glandulifera]|uniref:peptidyl-tRNA hydrolase, mitochondrial-like n=1 Tax=Impatiens glandulifera TaxID=253017 RepID=UPI001FB0B996|nr:peptidyl-tRNA hydrolase, mitochondrial-like [Impatiens glandulifera]
MPRGMVPFSATSVVGLVAAGVPFPPRYAPSCFSYSYSFKTIASNYWRRRNAGLMAVESSISSFDAQRLLCTASSSSMTADSELLVKIEEKKPKPQPWLIVGLGNPGKKYNSTRHNVGFSMIDAIAEAEGISMSTIAHKALFGKGFIGDAPLMLAKPQTFMNASGQSVGAIVSYYKVPLKQVLVVFDDLDLPFAKLRLLPKGGHGGHNGMRSIIDHFKGSRDFPRLRIGIGRPPGKMDPVNFVLRPFNKHEQEELNFTFETGIRAVRTLLLDGFDKSATYVNSAKYLEQLG